MKVLNYLFLVASLLLSATLSHAGNKVSPEHVAGATTVDTQTARKLFDQGAVFLDVRSNRDWDAGRIPGAAHLELKKVYSEETLAQIASPDQPLVIYCNSTGCMRSSKACRKAVDWGYKKVYYYRLGFPDWQASQYAIE